MTTLIDTGQPEADTGVAPPEGQPHARGPLSGALLRTLLSSDVSAADDAVLDRLAAATVEAADDLLRDDDLQLSLFLLYACAYGSLPWIDAEWEWHPALLRVRARLESAFEKALRASVEVPEVPAPNAERIAEALFHLTAPSSGPSLARYLEKRATVDQAREFLIQRSIYTLREADPHSWAIPRLTGRAKAALVEIQSDEYGAGRPERMHAELFARAMRGAGLVSDYGHYLDQASALILSSHNAMSMFGLNRRHIGAIVGHLAAFEMTSSLPNRRYADGLRRLGFGAEVTDYFDEHVEADAVHEQIAGRDLAGVLGEERPELRRDIFFGAAACLTLDDLTADSMLQAFEAERSSLRSAAEVQR